MNLEARVMDILQGRAKMGAGNKGMGGRQVSKNKGGKKKGGQRVAKRGPIQKGLTQSHPTGRGCQAKCPKAGVRAGKKAGVRAAGKKKPNRWMQHVKKVQKATGLSWTDAMVEASKTYKKKAAPKKKPKKGIDGRRKKNKKTSPWIKYVKEYARLNGMTYREALMEAGPSYHAQG